MCLVYGIDGMGTAEDAECESDVHRSLDHSRSKSKSRCVCTYTRGRERGAEAKQPFARSRLASDKYRRGDCWLGFGVALYQRTMDFIKQLVLKSGYVDAQIIDTPEGEMCLKVAVASLAGIVALAIYLGSSCPLFPRGLLTSLSQRQARPLRPKRSSSPPS